MIFAAFLAVALAVPAVASADAADSLVGRYDVAFEQVTSNCQNTGLTLGKSSLVVTRKAPGIAVELAKVTTLAGKAAKAGRLKAASPVGKTSVAGLDGKFSIAGTVDADGKLDAVFVGEFFADGKPVCTQSWSVKGGRAAEPAPATAPPAATPHATFTAFGLAPALD